MKLHYAELDAHLKKELAATYFISGDDPFLIEDCKKKITDACEKTNFAEKMRIQGADANWQALLYEALHAQSLFTGKRVIQLDLRELKFTPAIGQKIVEMLKTPLINTILLIFTKKLDKKIQNLEWYQVLSKQHITIILWPFKQKEIPFWLMQEAKKLNISLTKNCAEQIAFAAEGNLFFARQELEKLSLLTQFSPHTLTASLTDGSHFTIFDLTESILLGDIKRALHILRTLWAEGTEIPLIIWAITRELRIAASILREVKKGYSFTKAALMLKLWEKQQIAFQAFVKRHTEKDCWRFLLEAAYIDKVIKGLEKDNLKVLLEQFIMKLS